MAQVAETFSSYDAIGQREDLSDIIYNIAPTETPFMSNIGRVKIKAKKHEWQTDTLADAAANAQIEGDEFTFDAVSPTVRVGNFAQISRKAVVVSGTLEAVDKAGRKREMAYQMAKRSKELKRDMEKALLDNNASVAGDDTTARELGGLPSWLETNTNRGANGADGGYSTGTGLTVAATDGTAGDIRTFAETQLKAVIQSCFTEGADPSIIMVGPHNKGVFSAFTGIADIRKDVPGKNQATIIGGADMYVSDFGDLAVVPNRFQRERDAFVLDPEYAALGELRAPRRETVAKTGDAMKEVILAEYTLVVKNEKAHGVIADLETA
jgi:hypothetical protein